ncbi:MAG: YgjV family protein [Clostridia bacterium]|nr:YgjV family protein [Clostridia bacterium]
MDPFFITAQILGLVALGTGMTSMLLKSMVGVLILQIASNLAMCLNFAFLGAFSGAGVSIVATIHSFVIFLFQRKNKPFPKALTALFIVVYVAVSLLSYSMPLDLLCTVGAILFCFSVVQSKSSGFRLFAMLNTATWITYDLTTMAYTASLTHVVLFLTSLISIIRLDREEWKAFFAKILPLKRKS